MVHALQTNFVKIGLQSRRLNEQNLLYKIYNIVQSKKTIINILLYIITIHNILYIIIYRYIFVEGLDDDSNGIETCRPSPINNILMIGVFD